MTKRESRSVWAKRVERWVDSGLAAAQFEAETGISARRLAYWKSHLKSEANRKTEPASGSAGASFVEIVAAPVAKKPAAKAPTPKAEALELVVDEQGVRIRVPLQFDPAALRR